VDLGSTGNIKVEVFAGTPSLLEVKVDVYKKPVLVFERGSGYKGEYGFDDAAFTQLQTTDGGKYGKLNFSGTDYYVPWFSFKPGMPITLGIDFKGGLAKKAGNDKDFKITLRATSPDLDLNYEGQETVYKYNDLKGKTLLTITGNTSKAADISNPFYIEALDQKGDLIGKMAVVCGSPAMTKKVVFVFVDHGNGYPSRSADDILDFLNQKSHNQFFREWVKGDYKNGIDSLDISKEYKASSSDFSTPDKALNKALSIYKAKSKQNIIGSDPADNYYLLVTDLPMIDANSSGNVTGVGRLSFNQAMIFKTATTSTVAHELGHCLGFDHTKTERSIPEGTTVNYMDYSTTRNMFFLYQWIKAK
jgi:predicted Zn-dependent protease